MSERHTTNFRNGLYFVLRSKRICLNDTLCQLVVSNSICPQRGGVLRARALPGAAPHGAHPARHAAPAGAGQGLPAHRHRQRRQRRSVLRNPHGVAAIMFAI